MIRMEIKTRVLPADEAGVAEAAQLLRQGQLVALPTETVYGIAADARNGAAVPVCGACKMARFFSRDSTGLMR